MKRFFLPFVALLAVPPLVLAQDSDPARAFREMEWARHRQTLQNQIDPLAKIPVHERVYDVTFYDLDVTLDPSDSSLVGSVRVHARSLVDTLSRIELDLNDTLDVASVGEDAVSYTHADHLLTVELDRTYTSGEEFVVEVAYGGTPRPYRRNGLAWRLHGSEPVVYTMVEPFFSHHWWPCKDVPWDKADSSSVSITVPDPLVAVSNGLRVRVDSTSTPGWRTHQWKTRYPIPPYLIFIAASNYILLQDVYDNGVDPSVPITHYVFPEDQVAAETTFAFTTAMLDFLEPVFGAYPFRDERYGHVEVWGTGAMEHNTCTSWGDRLVVGNRGSDDVVVHEMGHQWWGDLVTCADWNHIWLNEGFATYTEALWREHRWGQSGLTAYMKILEWHGSQPVYVDPVPDLDTLFSSQIVPAIYYKGSWVLHMLRHEMDDEDFFLCLEKHQEDSIDRGGFATTDQFRASCEAVTGLDLERFFRQWVYRGGSPAFEADPFVSASGETLWLRLRQDREQDTCFATDLDITLYHAGGGTELVSLPVRSWTDTFFVETEEEITGIAYDEENWFLDEGFSSSLDSALAIADEDGRVILSWDVEDPFVTGVLLYRGATDRGPWERVWSSITPLPKEGEWDDGVPTERRYYVIRALSDSLPGYLSFPSNAVGTATPSSTELVFGTTDDPASSNPFFLGGEPYKIRFQLAQSEASRVLIQVYDITGRLVRTLYDGAMNPGYSREVEWNGENSEGREVAQGIYLIRFEAGEYSRTRKVVLLK